MSFEAWQIDDLRERVRASMSDFRFVHTAEVEKMAVRLGEIYLPSCLPELRAAALLHDITKEKTPEEQKEILAAHGIAVTELDMLSPKTLHAKTAPLVALDSYAEFAAKDILTAIRRHTTGHEDMSVFDQIIYLADYIDMSRKFSDCVKLREYFFDFDFEGTTEEERLLHLYKTILMSFDMTVAALAEEGAVISLDTVSARNEMIRKIGKIKAV